VNVRFAWQVGASKGDLLKTVRAEMRENHTEEPESHKMDRRGPPWSD